MKVITVEGNNRKCKHSRYRWYTHVNSNDIYICLDCGAEWYINDEKSSDDNDDLVLVS
jgi:hypothetical protein